MLIKYFQNRTILLNLLILKPKINQVILSIYLQVFKPAPFFVKINKRKNIL